MPYWFAKGAELSNSPEFPQKTTFVEIRDGSRSIILDTSATTRSVLFVNSSVRFEQGPFPDT